MDNQIKNWEQMHRTFNTVTRGKAGPRVADSIFIAWPIVLHIIKEAVMERSRVLDYGCGIGGFCRHLRSAGMKVEGADFSSGMIATAAKKSHRDIRYHSGDKGTLKKMTGRFDVVTSLMTFQFMKDIETRIPLLSDLLTDRGLLIFAVHNPEFVEDCCRNKTAFHSLRHTGQTTTASMDIGKSVSIDTYVRGKDHYRKLFEKHGFEYISTRFPPFTPAFITEHNWTLPSDNAEYLIMTLRKKN